MGISYEYEDEIHMFKTLKDIDAFVEVYEFAEEVESNILMHFRLATIGEVKKENTQPFYVDENIVFTHNGTLRGYSSYGYKKDKDDRSDTKQYCDKILKGLPDGWYKNDAILTLIENEIGYSNKFAFLVKDHGFVICNASSGSEVGGIWFSNLNFLSRGYRTQLSDVDSLSDFKEKKEDKKGKSVSGTRGKYHETVFAGAYFHNSMMCWDCMPESIPQAYVGPIYESIQDKYCVRCGRDLSNKSPRNVAQRTSGGFNHPMAKEVVNA